MSSDFSELSFGEAVFRLRKQKEWTVRDLIARIADRGGKVSPAYITRIEQYGEIPSPEMILTLAEVFQVDGEKLLQQAKKIKVQTFEKGLGEKYQKAIAQFRTQRKKTWDRSL